MRKRASCEIVSGGECEGKEEEATQRWSWLSGKREGRSVSAFAHRPVRMYRLNWETWGDSMV